MKAAISALITEKIDVERCIYELKILEGSPASDETEPLREALAALAARADELGTRLQAAKERADSLSLSSAVDKEGLQSLEKLHRGLTALEASLRRQKDQIAERLRLRIQRRLLLSGLNDAPAGQLDELRREDALISEGNSRADRIIVAGTEILSSLDRQRSSLQRVFGELRHIGGELRASEWTAAAVRKRLQSDSKLVLLLALVGVVLVLGLYCILRR